ncbi:MAG: malto-oligosyltrehalose synthase [Gemmatimonadales bacterium]
MAELLASYRLQLHAGFPLSRVREVVPYLHRLGITHLHCSPLLHARRGSTHGYDVVDPGRLNPALGTEAELAELAAALRQKEMGIVLDVVPNHMAVSSENPAWEDVLAHGPASRYARWFDVDWRATERELRSRVLLPVLGDHRVRVLQRGEIGLALEEGRLRVRYHDHSFPLDPASLPVVLQDAAPRCNQLLGTDHPACGNLQEVITRLRQLPRRTHRSPAAIARRREIASAELERLRQLCLDSPEVAVAVGRAATAFSRGSVGLSRLRRLLDAQVYRLVYWRRAAREINYRRFFDIDDLVALHMEDPEVFAETHALVLEWGRQGWLQGFRIDHPDGLLDPLGYFQRLVAAATSEAGRPPPIYVEKILSPGERLRSEWPVAGTTGYDFLNQTESLFIDPAGYRLIEQEYRRIIRQPLEFPSIARLAKRQVLESGLSAGVRRLADRLLKLSGRRTLRPVKPHALAVAIVETIASLPVYRTYVDPSTPEPGEQDRRLLEAALADARARGRASAEALDLLGAALLASDGPMREPETEGLRVRFVQHFQQLSGPATAKGVEDTAFYSYAPLLSRNEVGGDPALPLQDAVAEWHSANGHRAQRWPRSMLAVTTHDTKRSADVRSRLDVLSEIPDEWLAAVERWRDWNRGHKRDLDGHRAPDPNTVYHLLQAFVGVWPAPTLDPAEIPVLEPPCLASLRERLVEYSLKAAREAKLKTSWTEPDTRFEAALQEYVEAVLDAERSPEFLGSLASFVQRIARVGMWNGLSRTLLELASPGIPDLYQGDELWNLALVDPDNRRPVDFELRSRLLDEIEERWAAGGDSRRELLCDLLSHVEDGRLKLHLVRAVLHARREHPQLFLSGGSQPLLLEGPASDHVIGFARRHCAKHAIVLAPRMLARQVLANPRLPTAAEIWEGTGVTVPEGWPVEWRCALSGETLRSANRMVRMDEAFRRLPVALLLGQR